MDDISFTTFIKIGLKPTTQGKFGALQTMLNGSGGYDFYKKLKMASREVARGEMDREAIFEKLQAIKRPSEREHNIAMAKLTCEWWDQLADGAFALEDRPSGTCRRAEMVFGIRLVPELAYEVAGTTYVTYLWAMRMPKLTRQAAGAGLYLLREKLAVGKWKDARFQIRDLREKKTFEEDCITNQSANLLEADIAAMNAMWSGSMPKAA
jgi:hypothetical protein